MKKQYRLKNFEGKENILTKFKLNFLKITKIIQYPGFYLTPPYIIQSKSPHSNIFIDHYRIALMCHLILNNCDFDSVKLDLIM